MEIKFYRCISCGRADELKLLLKRHKCKCGTARVRPTYLEPLELVWFLVKNPSYLWKALRGEQLYGTSNDSMSDS